MTVIEEVRTATDADVLRLAADLLEEFGWCQGRIGSREEGELCLVGALYEAHLMLNGTVGVPRGIAPALQRIGVACTPHGLELAEWNDSPARTKREVVESLRRAAEIA